MILIKCFFPKNKMGTLMTSRMEPQGPREQSIPFALYRESRYYFTFKISELAMKKFYSTGQSVIL